MWLNIKDTDRRDMMNNQISFELSTRLSTGLLEGKIIQFPWTCASLQKIVQKRVCEQIHTKI